MLLILLFSIRIGDAKNPHETANYQENRARLLSYIIRNSLETGHFSRKKYDDSMSEAAFGLYLKQLDYQKRILLLEDVNSLRRFSGLIDDEMNTGNLELAVRGSSIFAARAESAHKMVKELLAEDFDFSTKEFMETDVEKIEFAKDEQELRDRWRKTLKYEILLQYLNQTEEKTSGREDAQRPQDSQEDRRPPEDKDLIKTAREKVLKTYEQYFSRIKTEKDAERYERFFNAVTRTFDPHTDYMPPTDKEDFDISMRGSLEGIGATLKEDEGQIKVVSVMAGSPASRQGQLEAEDIILKVAQGADEAVPISGMRIRQAVRLIRGKKGTEVRLTIQKPDDKIFTISIIRDVIQIEDTFVKSALLTDKDTGDAFGYIKIPSFYRDFETIGNGGKGRNVTDDVRAAVIELKAGNIKGLALDLRNNGGGALTDAVNIAGLFIETGPVVQVKGGHDSIKTLTDDKPEIVYDGPLVILVNTLSASASEIVAGALQNYGRAVILGGAHTHGKGTVQTIMDLDRNIPFEKMEDYKPLGALKLTIQKFYRINGESTQYRGILPDIVLPDVMGGLKTGEQYLEYALPWDTIKPVAYEAWQTCRPDMESLRQKSRTRVGASQPFIEMEKEASRRAEKRKNTLKSMHIDDVRAEIEEARKQKEEDPKTAHGKTKGSKAVTAEEKREEFLKTVSDDNYVKEAMSVITDMLHLDPTCLLVTSK